MDHKEKEQQEREDGWEGVESTDSSPQEPEPVFVEEPEEPEEPEPVWRKIQEVKGFDILIEKELDVLAILARYPGQKNLSGGGIKAGEASELMLGGYGCEDHAELLRIFALLQKPSTESLTQVLDGYILSKGKEYLPLKCRLLELWERLQTIEIPEDEGMQVFTIIDWMECAKEVNDKRKKMGLMLDRDEERTIDLSVKTDSVEDLLDSLEEPSVGLPTIDLTGFPEAVRDYVLAVAYDTKTPPELCAPLALGAVSALINGKVRVTPKRHMVENTGLYLISAMDSGEKKGPVFKAAMKPVYKWGETLRLESEKRGRDWDRQTKTLKGDDLAEYLAEYPERPKTVMLNCNDATQEAFCQVLSDNGGNANIIDSESTQLSVCLGRYSNGANFDVFLKAYSGESLNILRKSSKTVLSIPRPSAAFITTTQPNTVKSLCEDPLTLDKGFLPRFLFTFPDPLFDRTTLVNGKMPEEIPDKVVESYSNLLLAIAETAKTGDHLIQFAERAKLLFWGVMDKMDPKSRKGGELYKLRTFLGKKEASVCRLAAIHHALMHPSDFVDKSIGTESVLFACKLYFSFFVPHAMHAYNIMGVKHNSLSEQSKKVFDRIQKYKDEGRQEIAARRLYQNMQTGKGNNVFGSMPELYDVLYELEGLGLISIELNSKRIPGIIKWN